MKLIPAVSPSGMRRACASAAVTGSLFVAAFFGGVSVEGQTYTNVNWIAPSAEDYSTASAWDGGFVPSGSSYGGLTNTYVLLFTNGVECDYATPDNYTVGQMSIAPWDNSSASFVLNSGTLTVTTNNNNYAITVGGRSGANGSGGSGVNPTAGAGSTATFTVNGGTLNVIRYGNGHYHQDALVLGLGTNSTGTFTLNAGNVNTYCGDEIGFYGTGILNINGGTLVDNGWFGVGRGNGVPYGSGIFNMMGGAFYQMENSGGTVGGAGGIALDQGCTNAIVNICGGSVYSGDISFNGSNIKPKPMDYLNIVGGTMYIGWAGVYSNGGNIFIPSVNISGGTFQTVHMYQTGSGVLANNGSVTNVLSGGTNWAWRVNPPVNLTNSSFTVNGVSGPGYVTFAPETGRTITLSNNWNGVGGFTMSGPGTVNFVGANGLAFSGPLTINGGTMEVSAANSYAMPVTVNNGTLAVSGAGSFAMPVTVNNGILDLAAVNGFTQPIVLNNGVLALAAAQNDTNGLTINGGNLAILNGGSLLDSTLNFPAGSSLIFTNTSTITLTNIITGPGDILLNNDGVVNLGNNVQSTGTITQNNGIMVLDGNISLPTDITNSGPASAGPLVLQGDIMTPIGVGTNSALEVGTTTTPGTLDASNIILNGTWDVKINTPTTPGGGTNDLLVCSNLTLNSGSSILNVIAQTTPTAGTYLIGEYSGNVAGSFILVTNEMRNTSISVSISGGQIVLNVGASSPANLTWSAPIAPTGNNWDVNTSANWTNSATSALDVFHQGDNVTFSGTPGVTTVTNRVSLVGQIMPNSITINGGLPYIFNGFGNIAGTTNLTYNDTNVSGIYTYGNSYNGTVNINAGVLQMGIGGSSWLGTTNGATYINGGTLDLNGQSVGAEPLVIQGSGSAFAGTNNGAINNSGAESSQSGGPLNITLAGDTTINASAGRWDIGINKLGAGGGSFIGNNFNLTKIGSQQLWMHEIGDIGVDNIDIQQGELGFEYNIGMGNPSGTVTVESGATLGLYQVVSNLDKQVVLNNNASIFSGGAAGTSNNLVGPITLNGTNSINTSGYPLNLPGNITGTGGFTLSGTGPLYMGGDDTYSGSTIISANSDLALEAGGSVPNTPLIYMTPGSNTLVDASGAGSMTLNSGQTVEGAGAFNGNITANSGSSIVPGTNATTYGTFVFNNNLTLDGDTNVLKIGETNDLLQINGTLTLDGISTILVSPLAALSAGTPYTVMQAGGITGSAANLKVVSASPRYTMTPSISGGSVQVNVMGNAAPLEWKGNLSPNWDLTTSNWYNMAVATSDHFYNGDDPTFDDSSAVTSVVLTNNVIVGGIYMSNVANTYTFSGGGIITGPINMYGNGSAGGTTMLAMSNVPAINYVDSQFGNLVYNIQGVTNYNVYTVFGDSLGDGAGNIIFGGTNTVNLLSDNYDNVMNNNLGFFDGIIWVTDGVLRYTNETALGRNSYGLSGGAAVIVTNNGTLDLNGVPLADGGVTIHISGNGFNGQGALYDSKANVMMSDNPPSGGGGFYNLVLDGDAAIGSPNNLQQNISSDGSVGQVNGQGFKLTKVGAGNVTFFQQADGDTHFGDIDVAAGHLSFQGYEPSGDSIALGNVTNVLTVESNAEVTFFAIWNGAEPLHNGLDKVMWLKGGAVLDSSGNSSGNSNNFVGPVFLSGVNLIIAHDDLHLWDTMMDSNGPGGFVLGNNSGDSSAAGLWLDGTNTYSGPTIISNATVHVGANSTLGFSTNVQINSGATLDLSATPAYSFGANQTVAGNGTIVGPTNGTGILNFNTGSTLAIGLPTTNWGANSNTFTLTINNSVVLNPGSTDYVVANKTSTAPGVVPVDKLNGPTSLTLDGTVIITNYGNSFVAGDTLALFSATTITTNSGFNIVPATPGPNLAWNISSIPVNGTLSVVSTLTVNTNPTNIVFSVSGGNLNLSWPSDHTGWELEIQTNSLSSGISTNWVPYPGSTSTDSINIPVNLVNGTVFYRLVYPPQ